MGTLGNVLEALYEAPRVNGPLHIRAHEMQDQTVIHRVHEWWTQQQPFAGHSSLLITSSGGELERAEGDHELWWLGPERWRANADDRVTVLAADALYTYTPGVGGLRSPQRERQIPSWWSQLYPRFLIRQFDIELRDPTAVAGRACWSLELQPSLESRQHEMLPAPMVPWLGQEHSCQIDQETGIVLAYEGRFEGEVVSTWTTTAFEMPADLDPVVFDYTPPDGSEFADPNQFRIALMLRTAAEQDIDLSGVDLEDADALGEAVLMHHHRAAFPVVPFDAESLAQHHVPTAPPPENIDEAEAAVREAFERIVTPSEDGESVPAVQGGENLGPSLREAGNRAPGGADEPASGRVELIKFLGPDHAIVWFELERGGRSLLGLMEGRAYLVGSRWLVDRSTFCRIVGSVGVVCPPPPDH